VATAKQVVAWLPPADYPIRPGAELRIAGPGTFRAQLERGPWDTKTPLPPSLAADTWLDDGIPTAASGGGAATLTEPLDTDGADFQIAEPVTILGADSTTALRLGTNATAGAAAVLVTALDHAIGETAFSGVSLQARGNVTANLGELLLGQTESAYGCFLGSLAAGLSMDGMGNMALASPTTLSVNGANRLTLVGWGGLTVTLGDSEGMSPQLGVSDGMNSGTGYSGQITTGGYVWTFLHGFCTGVVPQ
jgi:hypothetical protein